MKASKLVLGIMCRMDAISAFADGKEGGFEYLVAGALLLARWYLPSRKASKNAVEVVSNETRTLLHNAITDRGFSLDNFKRCISVSNFSVICDIVANNGAITFAYEPISRCRDDLATFSVADMQVSGEFNFVYCNERVAREKINLLFSS